MGKIDCKLLLLQLAHEFIGCTLLGCFMVIAWQTFQGGPLGATDSYNMYLAFFLAWLAYAFAYRVSGGHLNSAVTLAHMCRLDGEFNWLQGFAYIPIQVLGHMFGITISWWFIRRVSVLNIYMDPATGEYWYLEAFWMEFVASFMFVLVHLMQTNPLTAISHNYLFQSAIIAFTYVSTYYWSFARTGGSNNPSFGFANNLLSLFDRGDRESMEFFWIYIVPTFFGAILSFLLYSFIYLKAHQEPSMSKLPVNKV